MAQSDGDATGRVMLRCTMCRDRYKTPRILPCAHSFCHECLVRYANGETNHSLSCPTCKQSTELPKNGIRGLPLNICFINLLERLVFVESLTAEAGRAQTCNFCQREEIAAFCLECSIAICGTCQKGHSRLPGMKVHSVISIDKVSDPTYMAKVSIVKAPYCTMHEREKVRYYCTVCETLVCRDCTILGHREHECMEAKKQAPQAREGLRYLLDEGGKQMKEYVSHIDTGKRGIANIEREAQHQYQNVEEKFKEIVGILRKNKDALCSQVMSIKDQRVAHLRREIERSSHWVECMWNAQAITNKIVEVNNPWEILALINSLRKAFDGLRRQAETRKHWEKKELELGGTFSSAYSSADLAALKVGDIVEETLVLLNYDPVRNKVERHFVPPK